MRQTKTAIACLAAGLAVACATRTARPPAAAPAPAARAATYWQVHAILRDNCEHCHNEDKAKGGLLTSSYAALLAGGEHGETVVPGQSASSRLVQMIEGSRKPRMPYKEDPLRAADVDVIRRWIDAGAPAPGANETEPPREFRVPDVKPAVPAAGAVAAVAFDPGLAPAGGRQLQIRPPHVARRSRVGRHAHGARGSRPRPGVLPRRPPAGGRRRSVRPLRRDQDLGRPGGGPARSCPPSRGTPIRFLPSRSRPMAPRSRPRVTTS